MLNSNIRRLATAGWLKENSPSEFYEPLKLQKYLFLYETFSKIEGEEYSFEYLKGYVNGPVFSEVYGDYTYRREEFEPKIEAIDKKVVNEEIAKKSMFLTQVLTGEELSEITHNLNIWKAKEPNILAGESQVKLEEKDFSDEDKALLNEIKDLYSIELIESVSVVNISNKNFIFDNDDYDKLTNVQKETLELLANEEQLMNPVFVSIGEGEELIVD
ncbi:hypothetical protein AB6883_12750 [Carnobacterium maltaromaticum]|uniref:hypothetical protein n=1 Tax=Carnobacterium maltaromaticum TaxID=2751 RepID=UPI00288FDF2B|nr:hypothetical protein [Carnobacterium maltaromaticum]MDT1943373.1 hypothetical protein [Carnobacterium maltaromaticum]MDT1998753.1 hypothetical protein [Carnobacterium maltaromaticum]